MPGRVALHEVEFPHEANALTADALGAVAPVVDNVGGDLDRLQVQGRAVFVKRLIVPRVAAVRAGEVGLWSARLRVGWRRGAVFFRWVAAGVLCLALAAPAEARRVALVIGQDSYPGGPSASVGLPPLYNSRNDARSVAALLSQHGFEVISCDGKQAGCFDQSRTGLLKALAELEVSAAGANLALVYFAGHGLASEEGNILTPIDAKVNCATGAVTQGIAVERFMAATRPAKHKLLILDACRDNPIGEVCPGLAGKKLSFTRIEAGAMQGLLLVTSTQFGQQALDGPKGGHSPFASTLLKSLQDNPTIYFEQVFNEVARATFEAAQKQAGFQQIPGKVVGGAAPADCLAGTGCIGDARMAALAIENERLVADAAGIRNILAADEKARGKPYTQDERAKRVAELGSTLSRLATSTDPLRQEARRLIDAGDVRAGEAKLDEALDADEAAIAEAERMAAEKRKAAARSARDLAVLASGRDVAKALTYFQRATKLDPSDPQTWLDLGLRAIEAGQLDTAKRAFEQGAAKARDANDPHVRYWSTLRLGDVAAAQGHLPTARRLYEDAVAIFEPIASTDPGNAGWQRDLSVAQEKIGDVLMAQGNLPAALDSYRASLAIRDRLAKADPGNAGWQRDLSVSHNKIGDVLVAQGNLPAALESYRASLAIAERLAKADPGNAGWQRDLALSYGRVASVDDRQGERKRALVAFEAGREIIVRLQTASPSDATLPKDLAWFDGQIANLKK